MLVDQATRHELPDAVVHQLTDTGLMARDVTADGGGYIRGAPSVAMQRSADVTAERRSLGISLDRMRRISQVTPASSLLLYPEPLTRTLTVTRTRTRTRTRTLTLAHVTPAHYSLPAEAHS